MKIIIRISIPKKNNIEPNKEKYKKKRLFSLKKFLFFKSS